MAEPPHPPAPVDRPFFGTVILPTLFIFFILVGAQFLFTIEGPLYQFVQTTPNTQVAPLGISFVGQTAFSLTYLTVSIAIVFGLVALLARKKIRDELFWVMALLLMVSCIVEGTALLYFLPIEVTIALFFGLWLVYILAAESKLPRYFSLPFMVSFAVMAGVSLVITLPPITILTMPIIFAVWDVIAVFKGPMTKLALLLMGMKRFQYLFLAPIGSIRLGIGDLLFYTILAVFATSFGIGAGVQTIGFMLGGVFFTMWILWRGKYRAVPALPIPIATGLLGLGLSLIGLQIP